MLWYEFGFFPAASLRPRPHVSGYFWKRIFFYPFSKRFASTRGAFSKISPSTRRRCYIQTSLFELRQKKTDNQNALLLSPKIRAHALIRRKSMHWRQRFRKAPFSPVHTTTWKRRFQKDPLRRAFSKRFVFGDRKRRLRVDANPKRIKKDAFSKISGYVWTGPYLGQSQYSYSVEICLHPAHVIGPSTEKSTDTFCKPKDTVLFDTKWFDKQGQIL